MHTLRLVHKPNEGLKHHTASCRQVKEYLHDSCIPEKVMQLEWKILTGSGLRLKR